MLLCANVNVKKNSLINNFGHPTVSLIGPEVCSFSFEASIVSMCRTVWEIDCCIVRQTHEFAHRANLIRENSAVRCIRQRYTLKGIWF